MKKYLQIIVVLGLFFFLVYVKQGHNDNQQPSIETQTTQIPSKNSSTIAPTVGQQSTQQNTPTTGASAGKYKNGTYTGSTEDANYGNIQVQITISGGKITDVVFLQYPNDNGTSRSINQQAMPFLKSEAIQVQNAQVDVVSGASDSSQAFQKSLANALQQAS